jgi:ribosome-associated protein
VNKRATKIQARVLLADLGLSEAEARLVRSRLASRTNAKGEVEVTVEDSRSQERNRVVATLRLRALIAGALRVRVKRVPTKVPHRVKERRLDEKKRVSEKKRQRSLRLTDA